MAGRLVWTSRRRGLGVVVVSLAWVLCLLLAFFAGTGTGTVEVSILIDPVNGTDTDGCGVSGANVTACASVLGALTLNNVTKNLNTTSYSLNLANGTYQGENNQNITLPANIWSISSMGADPDAVVFVGHPHPVTVGNDTYYTNNFVFSISSSVIISNISFSGTFCNYTGDELTYNSPILINVTSDINTIKLSNIKIAEDIIFYRFLEAYLTTGTVLYVDLMNVAFKRTFDSPEYGQILYIYCNDPKEIACTSDYVWPVVLITDAVIQGDGDRTFVLSKDVSLSIYGLSADGLSDVSSLIFGYSSICSDDYRSDILLDSISITNSHGNGVLWLSGNDVTLSHVILRNIVYTLSTDPLVAIWPISLTVANSIFEMTGTRDPVMTVRYEWDTPCFEGDSRDHCTGLLWKNLPVDSTFSNVSFIDNAALALQILIETSLRFSPKALFTDPMVLITIASCEFSNNSGFQTVNRLSGAIEAVATVKSWKSSGGGSIYENSTWYNQLLISDSVFSNNTAESFGGAIGLTGVSATIASTQFVNNLVLGSGISEGCAWDSYHGGGAIAAAGYSTIYLQKHTSFINNSVAANDHYGMGGAIFCCAASNPYTNIAVIADGSVEFTYNTAPMIDNLSCQNSTWHQRLPTCNFISPTKDRAYCNFGPKVFPVWLIVLLAVIAAALLALIAFFGYRRFRQRSYQPILD